MARPRNHVVRNGETATYHVWSRCVRRAFLCGADPYEEVAWRWKSAWADGDPEKEVWIATPSDAAIRELLAQPDKVAKARGNLSNLSWFVARWITRPWPWNLINTSHMVIDYSWTARIPRYSLGSSVP